MERKDHNIFLWITPWTLQSYLRFPRSYRFSLHHDNSSINLQLYPLILD